MFDKLMKSIILTQQDWEEFKMIFEEVHKNFFVKLLTRRSDLTESEIRLAALTKLNLSTKEMPGILGISQERVKKSRYRLRKKLSERGEFSLEQSLLILVSSIQKTVYTLVLLSFFFGNPHCKAQQQASDQDHQRIDHMIEKGVDLLIKRNPKGYQILDSALAFANAIGYAWGQVDVYLVLGDAHWRYGNNLDSSLYYHLLAHKILEKYPSEQRLFDIYIALGDVYLDRGDLPDARNYYNKALSVARRSNDPILLGQAFLDLGNAMLEDAKLCDDKSDTLQGDCKVLFSKSIEYFNQSISWWENLDLTDGIIINQLNKADALAGLGKINEAITISLEGLEHFESNEDLHYVLAIHNILSRLYIRDNDLVKAEKAGLAAMQLSKESDSKLDLLWAYETLTDIYGMQGNYQKALEHSQLLREMENQRFSEEKSKAIAEMQTRYETEKKEKEIQLLQVENELQSKTRNALIASITGLMIVSFLVIYGLRTRVKKNQAEKLLAQSKNELLARDLVLKEQQLNSYISQVKKKNKLLEHMQLELTLKEETERLHKREEIVDKLMKSIILTQEDWEEFKEIFEEVHKNFFTRLRSRQPNLTESEVRLAALTKLNLSTREMAGMLGISPESIKKSRYRLRKKLTEKGEESLEQLLDTV